MRSFVLVGLLILLVDGQKTNNRKGDATFFNTFFLVRFSGLLSFLFLSLSITQVAKKDSSSHARMVLASLIELDVMENRIVAMVVTKLNASVSLLHFFSIFAPVIEFELKFTA